MHTIWHEKKILWSNNKMESQENVKKVKFPFIYLYIFTTSFAWNKKKNERKRLFAFINNSENVRSIKGRSKEMSIWLKSFIIPQVYVIFMYAQRDKYEIPLTFWQHERRWWEKFCNISIHLFIYNTCFNIKI